MPQTATTGNLEQAQNIVIAQCLFTNEHNAPCANLVQKYTLGKGEKTITVPRVGQGEAQELTDGVDMVDTSDIGLSYEQASPNEVGLKFILTDKLVRQFNEDVFRVIGTQMGDAMARKRDKDVIALFSGLNNTWGADNVTITMTIATSLAVLATTYKFPSPVACVLHPNTLGSLLKGVTNIGATYYLGILGSYNEELLRNFWGIKLNGVNFFHDGNIPAIVSSGTTLGSGYGAIFSKIAMGIVESKAPYVERERDASLRAWEVNTVSDYKAFEVFGAYGGSAQYELGDLLTT